MDDFEDSRVVRSRRGTYQQVRKCIVASVLQLPKETLEQLHAEAKASDGAIDIHRLVAAHVLKVPMSEVTEADCKDVSNAFGGRP